MKQSFSALGVSAAVEQALAVRGIVEPFYIQSLVLPDALAGRDILVRHFPTPEARDGLRITIGTDDEIDTLRRSASEDEAVRDALAVPATVGTRKSA